MNQKELIDEKVKLIGDARAVHEKENLSDLDKEQFDKIMNRVTEINGTLKRMDTISKIEEDEKPKAKFFEPEVAISPYDKRNSELYNKAFIAYLKQGYQELTPEFKNILTVGTPSAGGVLVPILLEGMIQSGLFQQDVLRQLAKVITTTSTLDIPISTNFGTAVFTPEATAAGGTDPSFVLKRLSAFKMTKLTQVSMELMQDNAVNLMEFLSESFARAMGTLEGNAFLNGTGIGPASPILGILNDPALLTTPAAGAATITDVDLLNLKHFVSPPYRANASWLMHDTTYKILAGMKDLNGQFLLRVSLSADSSDMLYGNPIYISPYMPVPATTKVSVLYGDFRYGVWIGDRMNTSLQILNERYAELGLTGFLLTRRSDVLLTYPLAIAGLKHP